MSERKKADHFSKATRYWLSGISGHPALSAMTGEFPDTFNSKFIIKRLIGHHEANQSVVQSVPAGNTLVFNRLKKHILQLTEMNKQIDTEKSYPSKQDVSALNLDQALNIYDGLLANFMNNSGGRTPETLMLQLLEKEAGFSGYLLKSLDLYNLPRPVGMTELYGDGKAPQTKGEETGELRYWLTKKEEDQEEMYLADTNDLAIRVRDQINPTNNFMYDSIPDNFFRRNINGNNNRPSSVRNDLVHEVVSLINRNQAIDIATESGLEKSYPSLADLVKLGKADLLKLYREFGNKLTDSFVKMDKSKKITWWTNQGKVEFKPEEFMILALDHLSLHTGSLSFMLNLYLKK